MGDLNLDVAEKPRSTNLLLYIYVYIYIYIFEGNTIEKPIDNLIFNRRINWTDFQYKKI